MIVYPTRMPDFQITAFHLCNWAELFTDCHAVYPQWLLYSLAGGLVYRKAACKEGWTTKRYRDTISSHLYSAQTDFPLCWMYCQQLQRVVLGNDITRHFVANKLMWLLVSYTYRTHWGHSAMVWARYLPGHRYWTHDRTGAGYTGCCWRHGLHQEPGKVAETILLASSVNFSPLANFSRSLYMYILSIVLHV